MIDEAALILERLDALTPVAVRKATFVEPDEGFAVVDMGDSRFVADFGSGYVPVAGETVQVLSVGQRHLVFPAGPKPSIGTVATVSTLNVLVSTSAGDISMPFAGDVPASGDRVLVHWTEDGPVCGARVSTTPDAPDPIPDPGNGGVRAATFLATDTGSTDRDKSRWWTDRPRAGNTTFGVWTHGTQFRDTIPASAVLVSFEVYISYQQRKGGAPRWALHNLASKSGVPSFGPYTEWAPPAGWQTLPAPMAAAWFAALKSGGTALGFGLNQGGDNIFSSRADNALTGAARISWR